MDLQALVDQPAAAQGWSDLEGLMAEHWEGNRLTKGHWIRSGARLQLWPDRLLEVAGIDFRPAVVDGHARPLVVTAAQPTVEIPIGRSCSGLHVLGHVTLPVGYPVRGSLGETVAEYLVRYADGRTQRVPLRNGIDIASGNLIHQASRIAPETSGSRRALTFARDNAREQYQVLLFTLRTDGEVESLALTLGPGQAPLLLVAVTTESP
jgi:hypothetical protein